MKSIHYSQSILSDVRWGRVLCALAILWAAIPVPARAQVWMVSTTAHVTLGVLDKFGQLGPYTAMFVVHSERTGKNYQLARTIEKGQNGVDVLFPSEASSPDYFKASTGEAAPATPGPYTWECLVKGKRAVGGHFALPEVGNDVTVVQKERP